MRLFLAFMVGAGGLLTVCVGDGRAQSSPPSQSYGNPQQYLSGPNQDRRPNDDTRNLSAAPSTAPAAPDASSGSARELSQSERMELLRPTTRETPSWSGNRDRN